MARRMVSMRIVKFFRSTCYLCACRHATVPSLQTQTDPNNSDYHATAIAPLLGDPLQKMCISLENACKDAQIHPPSAEKKSSKRKSELAKRRPTHPVAAARERDRARSASPKVARQPYPKQHSPILKPKILGFKADKSRRHNKKMPSGDAMSRSLPFEMPLMSPSQTSSPLVCNTISVLLVNAFDANSEQRRWRGCMSSVCVCARVCTFG